MGDTKSISADKISELIKLNDDLENYFRNTIIPQLFVDANMILRKFTPPAMKQFEFTLDHIGRPMDELMDNIRYSTLLENIQSVIQSEEVFEKEIQTTDKRWFQMNIIPYIIQKQNKPDGVIITFIDITERINEMKDLEKLNAAHETFIYSVSHDLRVPLGNIASLVQMLTQWDNDVSEQKSISVMLEKSVKSMKIIIDELSEITKIEGNYKERIEKINFKQIFKEVELILQDKIVESNVKLHIDIQEPEFNFSRKNIRSIVYNLLSNAIKYKSPERTPEVWVKTEKENNFLIISVTDNGLGIPNDQLDSVFSKFTRIEKNIEGTGIGLYLVKKIVDNNGGKISVTSTLGEGSEFRVFLTLEQ